MSKQGKPVATTVGHKDQPVADQLLTDIRAFIEQARQQASAAVSAAQTYMYWQIGKRIHTELLGSERAPYGVKIVATRSRQLVLDYGCGFVEKNPRRMVQLAQAYQRWLAKVETEADENPPLGIIPCAGKNSEQIELLELDASGIHVAEYLTVFPPPEVLHRKLHGAIETARTRIDAGGRDAGKERTT